MTALLAFLISPVCHAQFRPIVQMRPLKRQYIALSNSLTAPSGARRMFIRLWGAGGGSGGNSGSSQGGRGGGGGYAAAEYQIPDGYTAYVYIGTGGQGGTVVGNDGKGGGGGLSTRLMTSQTGGQVLLIAGGGGGGGGAGQSGGGSPQGGDGGPGGFTNGVDGQAACGSSSSCPGAGLGGSAGIDANGVGGASGAMVGSCNATTGLSYVSSQNGDSETDSTPGDGGGRSGTCYANSQSFANGSGQAFYDPATDQGACTSGAGGGGRGGGGGGGVQTTGGGCAGGGGGAGYARSSAYATFRTGAAGYRSAPALTGDPDLTLSGVERANGGIPSATSNAAGTNGKNGLAVIYFY